MARPKEPIDVALVESLASRLYRDHEIAGALGLTREAFRKRKARDSAVTEALAKGRVAFAIRLRRLQWEAAQRGSVRMQIWLGKQYLGQHAGPRRPVASAHTPTRLALLEDPEQLARVRELNRSLLRERPGGLR
jgi:hypothetical protein